MLGGILPSRMANLLVFALDLFSLLLLTMLTRPLPWEPNQVSARSALPDRPAWRDSALHAVPDHTSVRTIPASFYLRFAPFDEFGGGRGPAQRNAKEHWPPPLQPGSKTSRRGPALAQRGPIGYPHVITGPREARSSPDKPSQRACSGSAGTRAKLPGLRPRRAGVHGVP